MKLVDLIPKIKKEYDFVYKPEGYGYTEYISEKYDLKFIFGSSNGETYYIIEKNNKTVLSIDGFTMTRDYEEIEKKMCRRIYKKIQFIVRLEKINKILNNSNEQF